VLAQGFGQLVLQRKIDAPGEQQVIEGGHEPQAVVVAEIRCHQSEIDIGAGAMAAGGSAIPLLGGGGLNLLAHLLGRAGVIRMAGEVAVLHHGQPGLAIADQAHPEGQ
jgi:hypothetical protein